MKKYHIAETVQIKGVDVLHDWYEGNKNTNVVSVVSYAHVLILRAIDNTKPVSVADVDTTIKDFFNVYDPDFIDQKPDGSIVVGPRGSKLTTIYDNVGSALQDLDTLKANLEKFNLYYNPDNMIFVVHSGEDTEFTGPKVIRDSDVVNATNYIDGVREFKDWAVTNLHLPGRVIMNFHLMYITANNDPAPFDKLNESLRLMLGVDSDADVLDHSDGDICDFKVGMEVHGFPTIENAFNFITKFEEHLSMLGMQHDNDVDFYIHQ